jgi:hypothetical protein
MKDISHHIHSQKKNYSLVFQLHNIDSKSIRIVNTFLNKYIIFKKDISGSSFADIKEDTHIYIEI